VNQEGEGEMDFLKRTDTIYPCGIRVRDKTLELQIKEIDRCIRWYSIVS